MVREDGEFVEAEKGYRGEYYHVITPVDYKYDKELHPKEQVRARHETVNRHFKQFGALKQYSDTILVSIVLFLNLLSS